MYGWGVLRLGRAENRACGDLDWLDAPVPLSVTRGLGDFNRLVLNRFHRKPITRVYSRKGLRQGHKSTESFLEFNRIVSGKTQTAWICLRKLRHPSGHQLSIGTLRWPRTTGGRLWEGGVL